MNRRQSGALAGIIFGGGLLVAGPLLGPDPALIYNPTESAEPGWYRVHTAKDPERGDLVAARLPDDAGRLADARGYLPAGLPVIKTIGAVGGDEVCWTGQAVSLPGGHRLRLLDKDSAGRPLPRRSTGCVTLRPEEVFLASDRIPGSFDSRYFGPVDADLVIGPVELVASFRGADAGQAFAKVDGGRLAGYCKIKARSAEDGLEPCLHIDFESTIRQSAARHFDLDAVYLQAFEQRYFTHDLCTSPAAR